MLYVYANSGSSLHDDRPCPCPCSTILEQRDANLVMKGQGHDEDMCPLSRSLPPDGPLSLAAWPGDVGSLLLLPAGTEELAPPHCPEREFCSMCHVHSCMKSLPLWLLSVLWFPPFPGSEGSETWSCCYLCSGTSSTATHCVYL